MTDPAPIPWRRRRYAEIDSTSNAVQLAALAGEAAGLVVIADRQTAGRGRQGRVWQSPAGNLYLSALLRPATPTHQAAELSFVAGLAVADAVSTLAPGAHVRCKWPNDVLLDDAKCAGILLESRLAPSGSVDFVVVGIGMNVAWAPEGLDYAATSLAAHGATVHVADAEDAVLDALDRRLQQWQEQGFDAIRTAWLAAAWRLGQRVQVRQGDAALTGRFAAMAPDGSMVLELDDGSTRAIAAGDVMRAA